MRYASVIVDVSHADVDRTFTYLVPEGMELGVGWQVAVPFGPRTVEGFILSFSSETELSPGKVRSILRPVREGCVILPELIGLAQWMKGRCLCNLVDALRLMLPAEMRGERVRERTRRVAELLVSAEEAQALCEASPRAVRRNEALHALIEGRLVTAEHPEWSEALRVLERKGIIRFAQEQVRRMPVSLLSPVSGTEPELTREQRRASERIGEAMEHGGGSFLLYGVTGSGKTEVYLRAVRKALERGQTAIVLVPEIALTPQTVRRFRERFGAAAAVIHSGLSAGERFDEWSRVRSGEARVVVGARSAIFAPVKDLGVVVVDEEHEGSYRSDRSPRYDAREVARYRAERAGAVLILGSATPSISGYMRTLPGVRPENRLERLELTRRVMDRPLPAVEIVDLREELQKGNRSIFSALLRRELKDQFAQGHQAMLFLNRRGYSSFISCRACGKAVKCPNCDVTMTYHRTDELLRCHYCGETMCPPTVCPACGSRYIKYFGIGTQKVQEEAQLLLPEARIERMDNDTTSTKDAHEAILGRFRRGETDILVGTQMIAKGLDFPNVTLVGVVLADLSLNLPDYRSAERTFQLLTQVAGRAGRADYPGQVVIQTYEPEHYAIALAARQDYRAFYTRESEYRRISLYPPFTVIARIVFTSAQEAAARSAAEDAEGKLNAFLDNGYRRDLVQMRSLEAPIRFLRGLYRYQVFLKMYFKGDTEAVTEQMRILAEETPEGVRGELEVDPVSMF